jgi:HlyD family secretion protein
MAMDKPRDPAVLQKRKIRRIVLAAAGVVALAVVTAGIYRLEPAALGVEKESVWVDTVKRGTMLREVRGPGTLVPEEIRWIAAANDGRVERIILKPGVEVKAGSVILELSNPELEQELLDAELRLREGESVLVTRQAQLESDILNQKAAVQAVEADWKAAKLQADADRQLSADKLIPEINLQRSLLREEQLGQRVEIEKERLEKAGESTTAQLASERARVEQLAALHRLRQKQFDNLRVRAGLDGVLQQVPVEVGQQVAAGTNLARVARPDTLKTELRIPETQAKDVAIGQKARIDNRNAVAEGRVARIDPAVQEGYVLVDVEFTGPPPSGARPDQSVDGTIEIERLDEVLFVGRPAYGQAQSTIQLFKLVDDGRRAVRTDVQIGRTSVNTVEILGGLQEGDRVILTDPSPWDGHDVIALK